MDVLDIIISQYRNRKWQMDLGHITFVLVSMTSDESFTKQDGDEMTSKPPSVVAVRSIHKSHSRTRPENCLCGRAARSFRRMVVIPTCLFVGGCGRRRPLSDGIGLLFQMASGSSSACLCGL